LKAPLLYCTQQSLHFFGGSLLFALGSLAFLPHLGCTEGMVSIGAWNFIVGSGLFLTGSIVSLYRTHLVIDLSLKEEIAPLKADLKAFA